MRTTKERSSLTLAEAAARLGEHPQRVLGRVFRGELLGARNPDGWRIATESIELLLASRKLNAAAAGGGDESAELADLALHFHGSGVRRQQILNVLEAKAVAFELAGDEERCGLARALLESLPLATYTYVAGSRQWAVSMPGCPDLMTAPDPARG